MSNFEALIQQFGEFEHNGCRLALTQQAFCTNHPENHTYQAHAVDVDGNEYVVLWDCLDGWMEMEDESDCCDWSVYTVKPL